MTRTKISMNFIIASLILLLSLTCVFAHEDERVPFFTPLDVFEIRQHSIGTVNYTVYLPGLGTFNAGLNQFVEFTVSPRDNAFVWNVTNNRQITTSAGTWNTILKDFSHPELGV